MVTIFVHRNGRTEQATSIDRGWLNPAAVWRCLGRSRGAVDSRGADPERHVRVPSAVGRGRDGARSQYPKIEAYDGYLYVILHGIDFQRASTASRRTTSTSSSGRTTSSPSTTASRASIAELREHVARNPKMLGEGPVALFHRIVDAMVDHYRPEVEKLEDRLDELEKAVFETAGPELVREILDVKRDVASLRRIITPQRDVDRPAGAARVRRHQHRDGVPVPRRLRPPRADRGRRDDLSGPHHRHARRAPVERQQPAERGHEGADGRRHDLHAADAAGRACAA